MALTITTAARNAACNAIVDLIDVGTTNPSGTLILMTSGDSPLAELALDDPAFGASGAVNPGEAVAAAITPVTADAAGTAAKFAIVDKDETVIVEGTVTEPGGGGDMIITNTDINEDDPISVVSLKITVPATPA